MLDLFAPPRMPPKLVVLPSGDMIDARSVSGISAARQPKDFRDIKDRVLVSHGKDGDYVAVIDCGDWDEACVMRAEVIQLVQDALS